MNYIKFIITIILLTRFLSPAFGQEDRQVIIDGNKKIVRVTRPGFDSSVVIDGNKTVIRIRRGNVDSTVIIDGDKKIVTVRHLDGPKDSTVVINGKNVIIKMHIKDDTDGPDDITDSDGMPMPPPPPPPGIPFPPGEHPECDTTIIIRKSNTIPYPKRVINQSRFHWGLTNFTEHSQTPGQPAGIKDLELNQAKSYNFYFGLVEQGIKLDHYAKFRWFYGIGLSVDNYRFRNSETYLGKGSDPLRVYFDTTQTDYRKSKLVASYATFPTYFEFKARPRNSNTFKVRVGADFSLLLGAYNKRMTENRDKSKIRDDFSLNPFRADGWVAVGTERLMVYARYGLSPMFKSNSGPDLRNISVGLVLAGN